MARKKCVLRACPHHHYHLDSIGGIRVIPLRFPVCEIARLPWLDFVRKYNRTAPDNSSYHLFFLCSAHFLPRYFDAKGNLDKNAVPTIPPEAVRELAIECGDMRPVTLERPLSATADSSESPSVIFIQELRKVVPPPEEGQLRRTNGFLTRQKRKHCGGVPQNSHVCPPSSIIGLQHVNSTLLKIWSGSQVTRQEQGCVEVAGGCVVEVVEKCSKNFGKKLMPDH